MRSKLFFKHIFHLGSFLFLLLASCAPGQETTDSPSIPLTTPEIAPTNMPIPTGMPPTEKPVLVAFAKDGDIQLWNSETNQAYTLLKAGDVTTVKMNDDGKVIFFVRRSLGFEPELMEHNSLWVVDSNGENPQELVSDGTLRQMLNPLLADSAAFVQISWIPGTHRILYNALTFYAPGQGSTMSKDIYVVDADTRSNQVLAANIMATEQFLNAWQFVLSPDSQQIALFTSTELSFINSDGSNWRKAVLTYPAVGAGDGILLPKGVWTQNSRAFIFTGPMESESVFVLNYTIWRVPADGSPAQSLTTLEDSHSASVTFSPDGKYMGYIKGSEWFITTLPADLGALAIPYSFDIFYANLHWSPAGTAFLIKDRDLLQLCPGATQASQVCGEPIHLGSSSIINSIDWVDDTHFLFSGLEPSSLSLGNVDGTIAPITTQEE